MLALFSVLQQTDKVQLITVLFSNLFDKLMIWSKRVISKRNCY